MFSKAHKSHWLYLFIHWLDGLWVLCCAQQNLVDPVQSLLPQSGWAETKVQPVKCQQWTCILLFLQRENIPLNLNVETTRNSQVALSRWHHQTPPQSTSAPPSGLDPLSPGLCPSSLRPAGAGWSWGPAGPLCLRCRAEETSSLWTQRFQWSCRSPSPTSRYRRTPDLRPCPGTRPPDAASEDSSPATYTHTHTHTHSYSGDSRLMWSTEEGNRTEEKQWRIKNIHLIFVIKYYHECSNHKSYILSYILKCSDYLKDFN